MLDSCPFRRVNGDPTLRVEAGNVNHRIPLILRFLRIGTHELPGRFDDGFELVLV